MPPPPEPAALTRKRQSYLTCQKQRHFVIGRAPAYGQFDQFLQSPRLVLLHQLNFLSQFIDGHCFEKLPKTKNCYCCLIHKQASGVIGELTNALSKSTDWLGNLNFSQFPANRAVLFALLNSNLGCQLLQPLSEFHNNTLSSF